MCKIYQRFKYCTLEQNYSTRIKITALWRANVMTWDCKLQHIGVFILRKTVAGSCTLCFEKKYYYWLFQEENPHLILDYFLSSGKELL